LSRIAIIGNSGGGESSLARRIAARRGIRLIDIGSLLWRAGAGGWRPLMTTSDSTPR
jgi:adenylate kinase family enzyme